MTQVDDLIRTVIRITAVLEGLGIPYHLTGGVSVSVYGEPRSTQDIDVVVSPDTLAVRLNEFASACEPNFIVDTLQIREAVNRKGMFQLLDRETCFKVDCYAREAVCGELSRSSRLELSSSVTVNVVSHRDAILSKLLWIRKGSHRSRRDVQSLFETLSPLEQENLRAEALEMKLLDLLETVLRDNEPRE